jgi:serpin B
MKALSAFAPLLLAACSPSATTPPPAPLGAATLPAAVPVPAPPNDAEQPAESGEAALANRAFGLELYRNLAAKPGNVFISPISLAGAFGPVAAGARAETREAIGKVLRFPASDAALHPQLGGLLRGLESTAEGARVSIANGLWLMRGYAVKPAFVGVARESYGAEVESLDFNNGAAAAGRINAWVERETNNRIRNLVAPDSLDEMTRVVVTNAVHFLGDWAQPFNSARTRSEPFYLAGGGTRQVPMMSSNRYTRYALAGPVQLVELPYKGGRLAMVAILPTQRGGLAAVEQSLTDQQLGDWLQQLDSAERREVLVQLPKVQVESSYQLNEPLKAMGMGIAFDRNRANFRGIADNEQLFISQVVHKTFLRIDERGTEAGAATAVEIQAESSAEPPTFRADHPFLVLIRDKPTGAVLFLGRIAAP